MNDRSLNDAEIAQIVSWVDAGAPEGNLKRQARAPSVDDGWNIRADRFSKCRPLCRPSQERSSYVYVVIPTRFISATLGSQPRRFAPVRAPPCIMRIAVVRPPGSTVDERSQTVRCPTSAGGMPRPERPQPVPDAMIRSPIPSNMSYEYLAGYSPGTQAERFDADQFGEADSGWIRHRSADALHDQRQNRRVNDQTRLGSHIAKEPPRKRFMSAVVTPGGRWAIPPGDPNYEGHGRLTFGEPVELVFLQPHMHYRGKDMTIRLVYPDNGKIETLLSVSHYDFYWQLVYYLDDPGLPQAPRWKSPRTGTIPQIIRRIPIPRNSTVGQPELGRDAQLADGSDHRADSRLHSAIQKGNLTS